jgi:peptidoglycan/xylan/chitin deacetylase (PgdA/CDA1 family)
MTPHDHRSRGLAFACAGVGAAAWTAHSLPALSAIWAPLRRPLGVADRTSSRAGVGLTFDDGPHPQGTPAVLEALAGRGERATFFLVGEQVARHRGVASEIVAAGHEIGLHCHRHRNLLRLGPRQVREDLERATAVIEDATGRRPSLYRPPYGILTLSALGWARRAQMKPVLWTHWGRDWDAGATPESITSAALRSIGPGAVLLLHDADYYGAPDCWRATAAALPRILQGLESLGLEPVVPL